MKSFGRILLVIAWLITFSTATGQSLNQDQAKGSLVNLVKAVDDSITIVEQPQNDTTCLGGNGVFEVIADSPGNMWYSWQHNNNWISEGSSSKLIIENVEFADTGRYFCILANSKPALLRRCSTSSFTMWA